MQPKRESSEIRRLVREVEAKQRNITWPDTMINGRSVDEFLWKGAPNAPLVQRIGAWIFGLFFVGAALFFADIAYEKGSAISGLMAVLWLLLGIRICTNGIRRKSPNPPDSEMNQKRD